MVVSRLPIDESSKVFDDGAGSGMLTSLIIEQYPNTAVTAADVSSGMIETLKKNKWSNVEALVADACDLGAAGLKSQRFTHSIGTFYLNFVSSPQKAITEMARVTKPGGIVALASWHKDTPSWTLPWQKAVRASMNPDWEAPPVFHHESTNPEDIERLFLKVGLQDVEVKVFRCPHPKKESVDAAVDEFIHMGNPSVDILTRDFTREQIEGVIRKEFKKAYAEIYDGVEQPQNEWAVLAVGRVAQ